MIVDKYEKMSCPALVSKRIENEIIDLSLKTYIEVGCRDYAPLDLIMLI
jgi:D-alanine-D-alanine ligase-like ATP-grasp enzyme